jgi:hypothetical protein
MSDQVTPEINSAADLARLRSEGRTLSSQELKELSARVKALEEMARLEDRLRTLENRKRPRLSEEQLEYPASDHHSNPGSRNHPPILQPSIELGDSDSSSDTTQYRTKRRRYTKGIKVNPSYTLRVSSSLREWGDWKRDIERVFEGDPDVYQRGTQKILKALDYLDPSLKSLWYTYSEQSGGIRKWPIFLTWTHDNIQNGQNATATLYEQLNAAKQLPDKSPVQFNAYLAAIERDLPQQDETASAMTFYSKLTRDLKRQFKTSDIPIPNTRAKCVAVAQRVWEGLHGPAEKGSFTDRNAHPSSATGPKYPRIGSERDRKDQNNRDHRKDNQNPAKSKPTSGKTDKELICYQCNKPGHYATNCPDRKEPKAAKIQSLQQEYPTSPSPQPSPDTEPYGPQEESEDSSDSLN